MRAPRPACRGRRHCPRRPSRRGVVGQDQAPARLSALARCAQLAPAPRQSGHEIHALRAGPGTTPRRSGVSARCGPASPLKLIGARDDAAVHLGHGDVHGDVRGPQARGRCRASVARCRRRRSTWSHRDVTCKRDGRLRRFRARTGRNAVVFRISAQLGLVQPGAHQAPGTVASFERWYGDGSGLMPGHLQAAGTKAR